MFQSLKILHYIPTYAPAWKFGGPVLSVSQLCEGLVKLGHSVEVFTSTAGLEPRYGNQRICRNGVVVNYFKQVPGLGIHCPGMERAVQERGQDFDLIHVTGVWQRSSFAACQAAQQKHIPYVISPRGALSPYSWGQKTLKKIIYYVWRERSNIRGAAAIHYTTLQEFEECKWLNLPGKPFIIPNGLNSSIFSPDIHGAKQWRQSHGFSENDFILLNVGRLHHKKGLDLLPKVLDTLKNYQWKLIFLGGDDDGTRDQLQKQFLKRHLLGNVFFLDACEPNELPAVYTAANLFILPSRHENFGNVLVESMACSCPVLISDKVGLHHEILQSGLGWVLPLHPGKWVSILETLMQNPIAVQNNAAKTRPWIMDKFTVERVASEMGELYKDVISTKGGKSLQD